MSAEFEKNMQLPFNQKHRCANDSEQLFDNRISEDKLLTKTDVSKIINVSIKTIDKLVCKKEIPFIKIGRLVRFDRREIENWLPKRSHHVH